MSLGQGSWKGVGFGVWCDSWGRVTMQPGGQQFNKRRCTDRAREIHYVVEYAELGMVAQENGTQNLPEKKRNNSPDWLLMWKALVTAQTFAFGCKQKEEPQNAAASIMRPAEMISEQKVGRSSADNQSTLADAVARGNLAQSWY
ncbi:hypothetical protein MGYG_00138 [Nannizzia gypsea CBS 118893]|uniref:Uncharacterized protein n=1 Tax=Arthroderma gypseum (strain ATCC MYA-4604 / CBS 118893) TaxID=535722 RepID=E5R366_ARTGP|nr:hypothetical protein MGYG_00138 [Nannizzia gypsea CBS 118893]EFQ97095.1 hypothetical protein MGYG_00138 [Nannizzia gypsea CBS 118893]